LSKELCGEASSIWTVRQRSDHRTLRKIDLKAGSPCLSKNALEGRECGRDRGSGSCDPAGLRDYRMSEAVLKSHGRVGGRRSPDLNTLPLRLNGGIAENRIGYAPRRRAR